MAMSKRDKNTKHSYSGFQSWKFAGWTMAIATLLVILTWLWLKNEVELSKWLNITLKTGDGSPSDWFTLILGTSVGFAGAWVAIKIADIATEAQKQANRLQDPEYEVAHNAAIKIESLRASLGTILALYRIHRSQPDKLYTKSSPVLPVMASIQLTILDPSWQGVVSGFCGAISENLQHECDTATARLLNSLHFIQSADQSVGNVLKRHFIYAIYQAHKLGRIIANAMTESKKREDLTGKNAYLSAWADTFNLDSLKVSQEVEAEVLNHYSQYNDFRTPLSEDGSQIRKVLEGLFSHIDNRKHELLYFQFEPGDSSVYDRIVDVCKSFCNANEKILSHIINPTRGKIMERIETEQSELSLYYFSGDPSRLLEYSDCLNNAVVILDGFPKPEWAKPYVITDAENLADLIDQLRIGATSESRGGKRDPDEKCRSTSNRVLWIVLMTLPGFAEGEPKMSDDHLNSIEGLFERFATGFGTSFYA